MFLSIMAKKLAASVVLTMKYLTSMVDSTFDDIFSEKSQSWFVKL